MNHKCYDFIGERKHDDGNQCTAICKMGGRQKTITWTAVYFDLQPEKSIINDINESLINAYLQIKISPEEFADAISEYDKRIADGGKEYYY